MKKPWFRAKNYGWGWYPASWQGWVVLLAHVGLMLGGTAVFTALVDETPYEAGAAPYFYAYVVALTAALLAVCGKTGERPGWRWGKRK